MTRRGSSRRGGEGAPARLSPELERLALHAVRSCYDDLNLTFFKGRLRRPVFALSDTVQRLGEFDAEARTLELSRRLLGEYPWGTLLEVLKHEMAHQYVDEVLQEHGETAHGPAFQRVCQERGFDARAVGVPRSVPSEGPQVAVLDKIGKLLSLAQSGNEHEARAAASAAQRLMLKHNLSEVHKGARAEYSCRHLGTPTGRVSEGERILGGILADYFFVETIWIGVWRPLEGKRGSVLEVCGSAANVEMAHYVHSFLTHTAERLWRERRSTLKAQRRAFIAGVMAGFRDQLKVERRVQKSEGLVWLGDPNLHGFFKTRHPHVRYTRYLSSARDAAHAEGRAAGARIVLHKAVSSGPSSGPKLLRGRPRAGRGLTQ